MSWEGLSDRVFYDSRPCDHTLLREILTKEKNMKIEYEATFANIDKDEMR